MNGDPDVQSSTVEDLVTVCPTGVANDLVGVSFVEKGNFKRRPDPTPEQIEERAREIRKTWRLKKGKTQVPRRGHRMYSFERRRGFVYCSVTGECM